jgi:hypothetical protein
MNKFFAFIIVLYSATIFSQSCKIVAGAIPLNYCGLPSSDLVYQGNILIPTEAHQLYQKLQKETRNTWTLADLEPQENDLWKNQISLPLNGDLDQLNIDSKIDNLQFISYAITRSENYGFTVEKEGKFYQLYLGTKIHNFIVRRNFLRKLGYSVPAIKYIQNTKVTFPTKNERNDFLQDFQTTVGRDISRWITSAPEEENYFYAQDLIAMEDQNSIPNLAVGYLSEDTIDNRRIFQSLIIPFALADIPESINMFSWGHGKIYSNNVLLPYEFAEDFRCNYDDAVWMVKRILSLSEKDWEEIAFSSNLPQPVAMLLYEKLKSRRNYLSILFSIPAKKFPVNDQISDDIGHLLNGSIEEEFFPGYGRRFKIPDPESPLAHSEMMSVLKSRGLSEGLNLLTNTINNFLTNNITNDINAINSDIANQATELVKQGKNPNTLIKGYHLPMINGGINLSRNIVAGSYLGTNNLIQLVDTIGVSVNVGLYAGLAGVFAQTGPYVPSLDGPAFMPVGLSAQASLNYNRNYAHVKPITSIKKALKYPFKNVAIPLLKREIAKDIKKIGSIDFKKINELPKDEREKEIQEIYSLLDKNMEIGESLIITDFLGLGVGGDVKASLYNVVDLNLKLNANTMILSRLHILRKSQNIFQIYKDFGNNNSYEVALGISKFVPIAKIRFKQSKGIAETKFYSIKFDTRAEKFKESILGLSQVIKSGSLEKLNLIQKPFQIKHKFVETNPQVGLIFYTWNKLNSHDHIKVKSPRGDSKQFYRRYKGTTSGLDFESYLQDLLGLFYGKIIKSNTSSLNFSSNSIGYTFLGKAVNNVQIFEAEVAEDGTLIRPSIKLSRIWNGWQIGHKKAKKILNHIKNRYNFNFVSEHVLAQTKKIFLYNFGVSLYIHSEGIAYFEQLSKEQLTDIFKSHQSRDMTNYPGEDALVRSGHKKLIRYHKKYLEAKKQKKHAKASRYLLNAVKILEKKLTTAGFEKALGSKNNFLLLSSLEGFRVGDERGDEPLVTNTLGSVGNSNLQSATSDIFNFMKQETGDTITEGEFFINWILGRVL